MTASEKENPDLFWAIRGGGGNFGVVTSFLFRLHPVKMVHAGPTFWPIEQTPEVMKAYREFITARAGKCVGFLCFPHRAARAAVPGRPARQENVRGLLVLDGIAEETDKATKPMRTVGKPALDHVGPMPFPALQTLFDPLYPAGLQWYWRADFVKELSDAAIAKHLEQASKLPTGHSTTHIYPINGAAHRVGKTDTAFSYRDANWALVIVGVDPDPGNKDKIIAMVQGLLRRTAPIFGGRRLCELHDGRGSGAREGVVSR